MRIGQNEIFELLKNISDDSKIAAHPYGYMTAMEFMAAVKIRRTKCDQLVQTSKIRIIKKLRKIHALNTEVDRYFKDSTILVQIPSLRACLF